VFVPRFRNRRRYVSSSKYPTPPKGINDIDSEKTDSSMLKDDSSQPQVSPKSGGVGVGVGVGVGKKSRGSRIPESWQPDPTLIAWAADKRPDLDLRTVVESFRDYWQAKSGKDATKRDWDATFRSWVRNEKQRITGSPAGDIFRGAL